MKSLQKALLKSALLSSVIAGTIAFCLFALFSLYQTVQMHDQIMDEMADILLRAEVNSQSNLQINELSEEFHIDYQMTLQAQVLVESDDFNFVATTEKMPRADEFQYLWQDQTLWRSYVAYSDDHQLRVWIVQPLNQRFEALLHRLFGYAVVLLVLWLLQWGISYFAIQRQFRPLLRLSHAIKDKSVDDLSAIPQVDYPVLELQPIVVQLNQLLQRLEQALAAEQRFTADASHELRSPLSAMQMRLQVLKRKYQDDVLHQDLNVLQQDIQRGTQILENLLLLARLDPTQHTQLPLKTISIRHLIDDVLQALHIFSAEKHLHIHVDCAEHIVLAANPELMFSCLRNLIDNAIRYTPSQGHIEIICLQQTHQLILRIENTGIGLAPEVIEHLGERFYRILGTKTQGSGLGLSICKKIIALHQGTIQFAASTLGGLKVNIHLYSHFNTAAADEKIES